MTHAKTGQCRHCGERFPLALRQGRNSRRARAGRERSYQDQRYCSATCRKLASKARVARSSVQGLFPGLPREYKAPEGTKPLSGVTKATAPINLASISGAQKATRRPLQMTFGSYTVVPDGDWLGMYRVRRPDGSLTDMVNLTQGSGCRASALPSRIAGNRRRGGRMRRRPRRIQPPAATSAAPARSCGCSIVSAIGRSIACIRMRVEAILALDEDRSAGRTLSKSAPGPLLLEHLRQLNEIDGDTRHRLEALLRLPSALDTCE